MALHKGMYQIKDLTSKDRDGLRYDLLLFG
jgi:hypothetical protein